MMIAAVMAVSLLHPVEGATRTLEEKFIADAEGHGRALDDLYSIRGLNPLENHNASVELVSHWLATQRIDKSPGYPEGTSVLFYAHRDDELTIYLIDTTGISAHHVVSISEVDLREAALVYRLDLQVDGLDRSRAPVWRGGEVEQNFRPITRSEHTWKSPIDEILLPTEIRNKLQDVEHLIIVANGVIGTNPFAAFPLNDHEMLIDRMSVTVAPSLFDIDQMIRPWAPEKDFRDVMLVGDPVVPRTPNWEVPRLPGAMEEISRMSQRSEGDLFLGEAATKGAILEAMHRSGVLYFAAHGLADPREPLTGGFLMLGGPSPEEAFLTAGEVQTMRLNANLVVLSACQSGLGFNHDGGVIGLARSFQKAGISRVIMSLWSVSDEATLYLMDKFQIEAKNAVPAEALRIAMLETREKYPDPALWAGFTLLGTPR